MFFSSSNNKEVAIVYFRAGYSPSHYKSTKEWDALYTIECSKAVKTPSIGLFLAGMKIVQQYLTNTDDLLELIDYNYELNQQFQSVFGKYFKLNSQVDSKTEKKNSHTDYICLFIIRKPSTMHLKILIIMFLNHNVKVEVIIIMIYQSGRRFCCFIFNLKIKLIIYLEKFYWISKRMKKIDLFSCNDSNQLFMKIILLKQMIMSLCAVEYQMNWEYLVC